MAWIEVTRSNAAAFLDLQHRLKVDDLSFGPDTETDGICWAWRIDDKWHQAVTPNTGPESTIAVLQALIRMT